MTFKYSLFPTDTGTVSVMRILNHIFRSGSRRLVDQFRIGHKMNPDPPETLGQIKLFVVVKDWTITVLYVNCTYTLSRRFSLPDMPMHSSGCESQPAPEATERHLGRVDSSATGGSIAH
jgi:hypothetical protein